MKERQTEETKQRQRGRKEKTGRMTGNKADGVELREGLPVDEGQGRAHD